MAKRIIVIGGSGFVGANPCRRLALKQQDFEIIDMRMSNQFPEKCKIADVRDAETLRQSITGDVVVNLAAVHRDDVRNKSEYQSTNVDGAENVALVCEDKGIEKIVFTSTVAVYGFADLGTDESGGINPFNEYGQTKFEAEERLRAWQNKGKNSLTIVRLNGQRFDCASVAGFAFFNELDIDVTIKELMETIIDIVGFVGKPLFDKSKPDGASRKLMDVSTSRALGYFAPTSLRTGLDLPYADCRKNNSKLRM